MPRSLASKVRWIGTLFQTWGGIWRTQRWYREGRTVDELLGTGFHLSSTTVAVCSFQRPELHCLRQSGTEFVSRCLSRPWAWSSFSFQGGRVRTGLVLTLLVPKDSWHCCLIHGTIEGRLQRGWLVSTRPLWWRRPWSSLLMTLQWSLLDLCDQSRDPGS